MHVASAGLRVWAEVHEEGLEEICLETCDVCMAKLLCVEFIELRCLQSELGLGLGLGLGLELGLGL